MDEKQSRKVYQAEGITPSERYLQRLCRRTFLSLWSYSGVHRNGKINKEVCDLLVVFENHVIIFSDKDWKFPNKGKLEVDWSRWFRETVMEGAKQIWGAEKWIKSNPNRLFLDPKCTQPFPFNLPNPSDMIVHRIVVAHGASKRCKWEFGGSGSLMINSHIIGDMHNNDNAIPFTIGQLNPQKGYVHVFDDTSLEIVMTTLDTITDFTWYLEKKEKLLQSSRLVTAAGEEDLLAYYLKNVNKQGDHDFVIPKKAKALRVIEGLWEDFSLRIERQTQLMADRISYVWDELIEHFNKGILNDDLYFSTTTEIRYVEKGIRFLAREPRVRRRLLMKSISELLEKYPNSSGVARVHIPTEVGYAYYVFLLLSPENYPSYEVYRERRMQLLQAYCRVLKLRFPEAQDIIGIAVEKKSANVVGGSEVMHYLDGRNWTAKDEAQAQELQNEFQLLKSDTLRHIYEPEYPR